MRANLYQRGIKESGIDEETLVLQIETDDGRVFITRKAIASDVKPTLKDIAELLYEASQELAKVNN